MFVLVFVLHSLMGVQAVPIYAVSMRLEHVVATECCKNRLDVIIPINIKLRRRWPWRLLSARQQRCARSLRTGSAMAVDCVICARVHSDVSHDCVARVLV